MKATTRIWASKSQTEYGRFPDAYNYRSLCPAAGEIVGQRLMQVLGIGTAPSVEVLETTEALRRDPRRWVFKPIEANRLKVCDPELIKEMKERGRWILLVAKVLRAIPLSFLRNGYGIDGGRAEIAEAENITPSTSWVLGMGMMWVIWNGKPELPNLAEFYSDFLPPKNWSGIKRAIAWDSDQMLRIHAARLFLGCSIAHTSNVLVDPEGRLYSVDHEFCSATDGDDLSVLFNDIKCGTRAFEALRGVAELGEVKLLEIFEALPVPTGVRWFRWPLGSKEKTIGYYLDRLRLWKRRFGELA